MNIYGFIQSTRSRTTSCPAGGAADKVHQVRGGSDIHSPRKPWAVGKARQKAAQPLYHHATLWRDQNYTERRAGDRREVGVAAEGAWREPGEGGKSGCPHTRVLVATASWRYLGGVPEGLSVRSSSCRAIYRDHNTEQPLWWQCPTLQGTLAKCMRTACRQWLPDPVRPLTLHQCPEHSCITES